MNTSVPVSERAPLLRLVDALTAGPQAPALLVQLEPDWAALALSPSGVLLVVLHARGREPWDAVAARAAAVLGTEQPEVLNGLLPNVMAVAMLGGALTLNDLALAPAKLPTLARHVHWIAAEPSGAVISDPREIPHVPRAFLRSIDAIVEEGLARSTQSIGGAARAVIERFGEQALANEAQFRSTLGLRVRRYTVGLLAACVVVFLLQSIFGDARGAMLLRMGALSGRYLAEGHPEVLLSYALLHGGVLHIAMNGLALNAIGTLLENIIGGRRMLFVFTLSALGGGVAVAVVHPDQLVVGASGGIFGLITALLGLALRGGDDLPPMARARIKRSVGWTLLINLPISLLPGVSLLGHAGGALVGLLLGLSGLLTAGVDLPWRAPPDPEKAARMALLFRILGAACIAALALSITVAWAQGRPWEGG